MSIKGADMAAVAARNNGASTFDGRGHSPAKPFLAHVDGSMYDIVARGGREVAAAGVSVIVPTRNQRALLRETVLGLLAQASPPPFEIVIVDDASDDGTSRALERLAEGTAVMFTAVRLRRRSGAAVARNVGVTLARGRYLTFIDSDVVPAADWLRWLIAAFADGVGVVQGPTAVMPEQRQPLFSHFVETKTMDGTFCTSNVAYLRRALVEAGGFDPGCNYWEDADLGWRVREANWGAVFAPDAITYHQVIPLSCWSWLWRARQFMRRPAIVSRHPDYRRHLFLGLWADPWHPLFDACVVGLALGTRRRQFLLLTLPYVATLPIRRGLRGRWPLFKALAHASRDAVALAALISGSVRHRTPVL